MCVYISSELQNGTLSYSFYTCCPLLPCHVETEQGIFEQVLHGDLDFSSDPWPSISEGAKDLVRRMLVRDPRKRLTAHEVLCESFCSYYFLQIFNGDNRTTSFKTEKCFIFCFPKNERKKSYVSGKMYCVMLLLFQHWLMQWY